VSAVLTDTWSNRDLPLLTHIGKSIEEGGTVDTMSRSVTTQISESMSGGR
jgi:hypothetical protein